ncbi:Uma2 family endonuclease [Aggregatilineales bacterium SYSU G02658]
MTEASVRPVTLADYYRFVDAPENKDRLFELVDGEFVEKMPSYVPSHIAGLILTYLNLHLFQHPLGRVSGADGSFQMTNGDILIPDVAFVTHERLPTLPERIALTPPDLAVEVMSPSDKVKDLRLKAQRYLDHGTRLVWLVFPHTQTVEVYDGDADVLTLTPADTLTGGSLLPEFSLPVADLFRSVPS